MDGELASIFNASSAARGGPTRVASIEKRSAKGRGRISSLDAMEQEIGNQVDDLPVFAEELRRRSGIPDFHPAEFVFAGSGDSFASSVFAHYLSNGESAVADPYELLQYPSLTQDRSLFITSVSGRTRANIELAKKTRRVAKTRAAVTANPTSPLALECDEVIRLKFRSLGVLTSGTSSFTTSLLALASRIRRLPGLSGLGRIAARSTFWGKSLKISRKDGFVFVGSGVGYALAMYGAFKIHEVLGRSADYEHTEQVGHSKLFSLGKTDNIILIANPNDQKTLELHKALLKEGFNTHLLTNNSQDPILFGLEVAFSIQYLVLTLARRMGLGECAFLTDKSRLALSSRLIY